MCQPSASNAIEWKKYPATISTSIMPAVNHTTMRVRFSAEDVSPEKLCSCFQAEISCVCIGMFWILLTLLRGSVPAQMQPVSHPPGLIELQSRSFGERNKKPDR